MPAAHVIGTWIIESAAYFNPTLQVSLYALKPFTKPLLLSLLYWLSVILLSSGHWIAIILVFCNFLMSK